MNQRRNADTEVEEEEEEEEMIPQSRNQTLAPIKNNPPQQQQQQQQVAQLQPESQPGPEQQIIPPRAEGYRTHAIRESRIKDRAVKSSGASDSALKIKIELDLEVEVDLYARVKGDVTIGLM